LKAYRIPVASPEAPVVAHLWDSGCLGIVEEDGALVAYFASEVEVPAGGRWEDVPEVDHVAAYHAGLDAVRVGSLVVAPSHRQVVVSDGDLVVWLDPGSAFGTGHHETTRMALSALERLDLVGKSVLDVGSGSGLLAIAADRLGAEAAYGVDVDPLTPPVARANARRNRSRARFALGSLDAPGLPSRFDVVVANLYAELHADLMAEYWKRLTRGGRLILTGILTRLEATVSAAAPSEPLFREEDGEWLLLEYQRLG